MEWTHPGKGAEIMGKISWAIAGSLLMAAAAPAQPVSQGSVVTVQRAVPFGTASGRLLLLGTYLVFVDISNLLLRWWWLGATWRP
jgi:hypothetical protein